MCQRCHNQCSDVVVAMQIMAFCVCGMEQRSLKWLIPTPGRFDSCSRYHEVITLKDRGAAKRYYIQGEIDPATGQRTKPSLTETALKYGYTANYLKQLSAREKWVPERESYHDETDQKLIEKRQDLEVDELSEITRFRYKLAKEYAKQFLGLLEAKKVKPSAGMALAFAQEMGAIGDKVHGVSDGTSILEKIWLRCAELKQKEND